MCTTRDMISPECVYISMPCALTEVQHVVLALVCPVVCLWRGPYGGKPTVTLCVYPLRFFSGIFLRLHPESHSSPTPDIPDTLPEVLLRFSTLEVSYKRNTFKGLLITVSSLVAISCSIADTIRTPYTPLIHYCYYCL